MQVRVGAGIGAVLGTICGSILVDAMMASQLMETLVFGSSVAIGVVAGVIIVFPRKE